MAKERTARVRDRSRSMGRKLRALTRTIRRRSGEAKAEVLALTEQTGELLEQTVKEARTLAKAAREKARGRGAATKQRAAAKLEQLADPSNPHYERPRRSPIDAAVSFLYSSELFRGKELDLTAQLPVPAPTPSPPPASLTTSPPRRVRARRPRCLRRDILRPSKKGIRRSVRGL